MEPLLAVFKQGLFEFGIIIRNPEYALLSKKKSERSYGFEVHKVRKQEAHVGKNGVQYSAKEFLRTDREFGYSAWAFDTYEKAYACYQALVTTGHYGVDRAIAKKSSRKIAPNCDGRGSLSRQVTRDYTIAELSKKTTKELRKSLKKE